jgi:uncharacterized protein (DUF1330 family)
LSRPLFGDPIEPEDFMKTHYAVTLSLLAGIGVGAAAIQSLHAQAKPPAYAIVEIDVTNQDAYAKEYAPTAGKVLQDNGGKFLARAGKTAAIDGDPPKSRVIVLAFESIDKAQAAFGSAAYREGRKIGDKYAKFRVFAVEGVSP